jgi:hypothetical protein
MIDDLTVLHQLDASLDNAPSSLFRPMDAYRMSGGGGRVSKTRGTNHPGGVNVYFHLKDTLGSDTLRIEFLDNSGKVITAFSTHPDKDAKERELSAKAGLNHLNWNMRYPGADGFEGMILWWASLNGPTAVPGDYKVRMVHGDQSAEKPFKIMPDPRSTATMADMQAKFDYLNSIVIKMSETNNAIKKIREVRGQINEVKELSDNEEIQAKADEILEKMKGVEENLYQTKNRSGQDPLNYPIKLNNRLGHLNSLEGIGDFRPTEQAIQFKDEVIALIDVELNKLEDIWESDIPGLNTLVRDNAVDLIQLED